MALETEQPEECEGAEICEYDGNTNTTKQSADSSIRMSCLYHSPKCRGIFQHLINSARSARFLPQKYLCKLGVVVCTCHLQSFHEDLDDKLRLEDKLQMQDAVRLALDNDGFCSLKDVLWKLIGVKNMKNQEQYQLGCHRLLYIFLMASKNSYDHLSYTRKPKTETLPKVVENKYPHVNELKIDFWSSHLSFLFGKNGHNIKQFSKLHNCEVKVLGKTKNEYGMISKTMVFKVSYSEVGQGALIEAALIKLTKEISEKREKHLQKVQEFYEMKRKRASAMGSRRGLEELSLRDGKTSFYGAAVNRKDDDRDNYSTKYLNMLKEKSTRKSDLDHPKTKILEEPDTWCVNCFHEYSKEHTECRYHKGYVKTVDTYTRGRGRGRARGKGIITRAYRWTCCSHEVDKSLTHTKEQMDDHRDTGCVENARHIWKPHKRGVPAKNSGKSSVNKHHWQPGMDRSKASTNDWMDDY